MQSSISTLDMDNPSTSHHIQSTLRNTVLKSDADSDIESHSIQSPHSPHSPSQYSHVITSPSSSISNNTENNNTNNTNNNSNNSNNNDNNNNDNNNDDDSDKNISHNNSVQFKNYTMKHPHKNQHLNNSLLYDQKNLDLISHFKNNNNIHYPTPNQTPTPSTITMNNLNNDSIINEESNDSINSLNDLRIQNNNQQNIFPFNLSRDENGFPILTREFVVRRISEGETGRLKEELKCESCGKGYKHITSLAKHLWEHTAEWQKTKRLLISKHQQAQLLEAASILCSLGEKNLLTSIPLSNSNSNAGNISTDTTTIDTTNTDTSITASSNKIVQFNHIITNSNHNIPMARRKSKSENTKAGKFGGKRRSKSFGVHTTPISITTGTIPNTTTTTTTTTNSNGAIMNYNSNQGNLSISSIRRESESINPPVDLRRSSMHLRSSISISSSRRGSLIGSLIREEENAENSAVLYDSEDEE